MMHVKVAHVLNHDIGLRVHGRNYFSYLQEQGYDAQAICPPGEYVTGDMVTETGIPVKAIPFPPRYTPIADFRTLIRLWHYFRQQRIDIVHTHTVKPGLLGRIAARLAGVPIVIHTVHGFHIWDDMSNFEQRIFVWVERLAARFCDLLLSQNHEDMKVAVRDRICPANRIHYLGNGIDVSYFDPDQVSAERVAEVRQQLGVAPNEYLVGMIGRLVRLKGYYDYMEAARIIKDWGEPIKFLTIGLATPEKADALSPEALIDQYGLKGKMQHLGQRSDVRELIAAMDTLVLASYAEGVPRVLMEAAAMGKAVVGTDVRGTREAIVDGQTGYLVPARNPAALADSIRRLLSDQQRAQEMGAAARRRAKTHFDERHYFWRTDIEYRRLLEEKLSSKRLQGLKPLKPEASNLQSLQSVSHS
ncbi:MAG: glycosyltransferase family 4 protein [Chloroflexota bacterium]|nr:glycosyltransferase family 4 protein [Chloroflexota bacterium]